MKLTPEWLTEVIGQYLYVVERDGHLYATDTYWMAPIEETGVDDLLRRWNLDVAPGLFEFEQVVSATRSTEGEECNYERGPLRRTGVTLVGPAIDKLLSRLSKVRTLRPFLIGTAPAYIRDKDRHHAVLIACDDKYVVADPDYLTIAFGELSAGEPLYCADSSGKQPIWAASADGLHRLIMPIHPRVIGRR